MFLLKNPPGYTILQKLGGGRYGVCYLAKNLEGTLVVLKRFRPKMRLRNQENNHHEAVLLSSLSHPAIPQLLGVINHPKAGYFFVLEYKAGTSLGVELFRKHKRFGMDEIHRIGTQLLEILEYLHHQGAAHRDVSIVNVLDDGEKISLVDFGLSRFTSDTAEFLMDYADFGHLLLFLLYSTYHGPKKGGWYEQLPLSQPQKQFLQRLVGLDLPFSSIQEIQKDFQTSFSNQNTPP